LILESSPYLVMHAHNPVDWYPWGDEAFERARREGKPVLLSIGYSTCHWCHVMEEESFEDPEIAAQLNQKYVAIKVDREERPDLDEIYMAAVTMLTGGGGWPMTVWLTPDRAPFFGGTYFPPRDGGRGAAIGLATLLDRLAIEYARDPAGAAAQAAQLVARMQKDAAPAAGGLPGASTIEAAVVGITRGFDPVWGGFGGAPKFPRPAALELVLRDVWRTGDGARKQMLSLTLERMAQGGMYDQLGGGFHRYSTDRRWLIPHFEKMLYDQAQLAMVYLAAAQLLARDDFAEVARETLEYMRRDLASPEGGFYAATDADSPGGEGAYFVWTPAQIDAVLGAEQGRLVRTYYDAKAGGNFEGGASVLWRPRSLADAAAEAKVPVETMAQAVRDGRPRLLAARSRRTPPPTDRKILTAWNGLALSALARGALVLGDPKLLPAAQRLARLLLGPMRPGGELAHAMTDGHAHGVAFLDDFAFVIAGLLDLAEVDADPTWMREARALDRQLGERFADAARGGYFLTPARGEALLARQKPDFDHALPSGNSVHAQSLLRLYEYTSDDSYRARAHGIFRGFAGVLAARPASMPALLCALDFALDRPKQVILIAPEGAPAQVAPLVERLRRVFLPNRVVAAVAQGKPQDELAQVAPVVAGKVARGGTATAYVCIGTRCELPTSSPDVFERQLRKIEPYADGPRSGGR
jgi:uncharacterized protein YyaL (SSP411 family)